MCVNRASTNSVDVNGSDVKSVCVNRASTNSVDVNGADVKSVWCK